MAREHNAFTDLNLQTYGYVQDDKPVHIQHQSKTLKRIRKSYDSADITQKIHLLNQELGLHLEHIKPNSYNTHTLQGNIENPIGLAKIPIGLVGPIHIDGQYAKGNFYVPLASTEGAMTLTYDLGARLLSKYDPIQTEILNNVIHITANFPFEKEETSQRLKYFIQANYAIIKKVAEGQSNHTTLLGIEQQIIGNNHLLKFKYDTADAHGLNMINQATFQACSYISGVLEMDFYHRSHFSAVKHASPLNQQEGYGRKVKASAIIPRQALQHLSVTAVKLKDFFDRCVECANTAGVNYVNVHAANGISAIYLACGQDMADISSSHVCRSRTELLNHGQDLLWEIEIPNLLVATVGGGTGLATQRECLELMNCYGSGMANKFAEIVAATVLAGEFPTAAAVVNKTYIDAHNQHGRNPPREHSNKKAESKMLKELEKAA